MYNNPFMYQSLARPSFISKLLGRASAARGISSGINWGSFLSNTQKTLGIINQAIPIVNQVKPMIGNAKAMFKIANILNEDNSVKNTNSNNLNIKNTVNNTISNNKPIFYV